MKRFIMGLILATTCSAVLAQSSTSTPKSDVSNDSATGTMCMQIGEAYRYVAKQRDAGIPIDTFIATRKSHEPKIDDRTLTVYRDIYRSSLTPEAVAESARSTCLKNNSK